MLLKHYLEQGVSQSELARRFGIDRTTIWRWVRTGQLDQDLSAGSNGYSPRPPVTRKLDPYKAIIDARLEEFPKLSAKRLFDETRAAGYPGCYEGVRNYVRVARPRARVEPTVRFETPAGRQGQMDFGTFTLPWGRLLKALPDPAPRHPACGKELAPELLHFHLPDGVRPFGWTIQPALVANRLQTSLRDAA
ncbi:MAG: helix-turn-helix domain-containing protein, partial [Boseongicola sp.]|nr:helix-turn-helix domain-containing protein [Boseongicola sp.]